MTSEEMGNKLRVTKHKNPLVIVTILLLLYLLFCYCYIYSFATLYCTVCLMFIKTGQLIKLYKNT